MQYTDVAHLCSIFEAAKLYFCPGRDCINLGDFKAFILMVAVKNKCRDAVMQLLENPLSKPNSADNNCFGSALAVASTLASQFINCELGDGLHEKSASEKGQVSLFPWAVVCGHAAVVRVLAEKGADINAKDSGGT